MLELHGPDVDTLLAQAFRPRTSHAQPPADALQLGHLVDGSHVLDEAVIFRRDGVAEINIHGGPAVAKAAMELFCRLGATPAAQRPPALPASHPVWNNSAIGRELLEMLPRVRSQRVAGALARQWSAGLSELAHRAMNATAANAQTLAEDLSHAAAGLGLMQKLLQPPTVVLAGPPNAGKSTLINALAGRTVSIVHAVAGTTRDWVRELVLLEGLPVYLTDTAGTWDADTTPSPAADPLGRQIDAESMRRARQEALAADLVVLLAEGGRCEIPPWLNGKPASAIVRVASKSDHRTPSPPFDLAVAAHTGAGLDRLRAEMLRRLGLYEVDLSAPRAFTARQAQRLMTAAEHLRQGHLPQAVSTLRDVLSGKT